ncbi:MAG TPA: hypothetical protein ENK14_04965 [Caldithrix sp.]|nr:hypothetical protein [Caldithrix sp.]
MQISLPLIQPLSAGSEQISLLKPGDRIAARVIKRLGPFRLLVNYRGNSFAVNSSVSLKAGDFVLLELTDLQPRLKFRFLSVYQPERLATTAASFARMFRFGSHPLDVLFVRWSLQLHLPVKQADLKKLKKIFSSGNRAGKSPEKLLLAFFSLAATTEPYGEDERFVLLQWMFQERFLEKLKREINRDTRENEISPDHAELFLKFFERLDKTLLLKNLFFAAGKFSDGLGDLFPELTNESLQQTQNRPTGKEAMLPVSGKLYYRFSNEVVRWLVTQVQNFENGKWVFLPFFREHSRQNLLTFWRKNGSGNSQRYEFRFVWNSGKFGDVSVTGSIQSGQIRLEFSCSHQDFRILVDKQITSLVEKLENTGLKLTYYRIVHGKNFYSIMQKMLYNNITAKLEVTV